MKMIVVIVIAISRMMGQEGHINGQSQVGKVRYV